MTMAEEKCAMAEAMIARIVSDDVDEVSAALSTADRDTWCSVLRYEFDIEQLVDVDGFLHYDIVAPKLLCVGAARTLTPWHVAGLRGADDVLTMFVDRLKMPVDCQLPSSGATALQFACFAGHVDMARTLIDQLGSAVNRRDEYGWTALHYAAVEGHVDVVELLLSRNIDVSVRDTGGATAAWRARQAGHQHVVRLIQSTADEDSLLPVARVSDDEPTEQLYASVSKVVQNKNMNGTDVILVGDSIYDLVSTATTRQQATAADLERQAVDEQLSAVQGDHITRDTYATLADSCSSAPLPASRIDNVGYSTLTHIVRQELSRFLTDAETTERSHDRQSAAAVPSDNSQTKACSDYEEIGQFFCQRDSVTAPSASGRAHDVDVVAEPTTAAPPLPAPRRHVTSANSDPEDGAVDTPLPAAGAARAPLRFVGRRRPLVDKRSVILLLGRIEQSTAQLDGLFTGLVDVGLRNPGDWQRLARDLPICSFFKLSRRISSIEARYRGDRRRQAAAALAEWRSYRGNKATLRELIAALKRCRLLEETQFLERMQQESAV